MGVPVVVFGGAGHRHDRVAPTEFIGTLAAIGRPVVWVNDLTATWYASPGMADRIVAEVGGALARLGASCCDTLGFSMGAFGALAFAERLPVRLAVALSPRLSPDAAVLGDHRAAERLAPWQGRFPFANVGPGLARVRGGLVLHGLKGPDFHHAAQFPVNAAVGHWVLPQVGHRTARWLKAAGALDEVVSLALADDTPALRAVLRRLGARPIGSRRWRLLRLRARRWLDARMRRDSVADLGRSQREVWA